MKTEKFKVTPLERAWILYDVGNSAFVLMIATLVPIFFNALAEAGGVSKVDYLAYWGYASSIVTVVTAILGPILGTLADTKGFKKPIFMLCLFVGVIGCCAMGLAGTWPVSYTHLDVYKRQEEAGISKEGEMGSTGCTGVALECWKKKQASTSSTMA